MITRLSIRNYALIKEIDLELAEGFNVITGETGAGKSVMLGALSLLRGKRFTSRDALHAAEPAVVEASFELSMALAPTIEHMLMEAGVPSAGTSLVLRREISPSGRSKAVVNGSAASLALLEGLSERLVEIHSQQANRLLADARFQLQTLDAVADNAPLRAQYSEIYARYRRALREFSDTRDEIERTRADADYLQFQYDKLAAADPQPGEIAELEQQRDSLAARTSAGKHLIKAAEALKWDDGSALSAVGEALGALEELPDDNPTRTDCLGRLQSLRIELADIAGIIETQASETRDDPAELDRIEERISLLYSLLARHNVQTDTELAAIRDDIEARLSRLNDASALLRDLKAAAVELKRLALEAADKITASRIEAARRLEAELAENARPLAMANLQCSIAVEPGKLNADGRDTVTWLFSFNKNQPLTTVDKTASGGEVSRLMLVLKCILAGKIGLPTIIFDEVDTGVSGDVAGRMAALMTRASAGMQIVVITHLPQVAAAGTTHFKVYKRDDDAATITHISLLDRQARRAEIATMLSGDPADPTALATADSLLNRH